MSFITVHVEVSEIKVRFSHFYTPQIENHFIYTDSSFSAVLFEFILIASFDDALKTLSHYQLEQFLLLAKFFYIYSVIYNENMKCHETGKISNF